MQLSARNQIQGKVVSVEIGAVNAIVKLELDGGAIISADITKESVEQLGLEPGKEAVAVIKASDVMVGVA